MTEYAYNPFSGNLDRVGEGGGGGGNVTINTDSGLPITGDEFFIIGQEAGTVPVMETANSGGDTLIINNAWVTQYIVDPSNVVGLKGTFQTIQAAIDQAILDGMSSASPRKIILREGDFTEDLTIPDGAVLQGQSLQDPTGLLTSNVTPVVNGNHTIAGIIALQNIHFVNLDSTEDLFTSTGPVLLYNQNCNFINESGSGVHFNITEANSVLSFTLCSFYGLQELVCLNIIQSRLLLDTCYFNAMSSIVLDNSIINFNNCTGIGQLVLGSGSLIQGKNTTFNTLNFEYAITGEGTGDYLIDCLFSGYSISAIQSTITNLSVRNLSTIESNGNPPAFSLYEDPDNVTLNSTLAGNVMIGRKTATNYSITYQDFYLGVTDTSAPRTINLVPTNCVPDQIFFIKDESNASATNNITITAGGTILIDNATTTLINANSACKCLRWDGVQYWTISDFGLGVLSVEGDIGTISGSNIKIWAGNTGINAGSSVWFENSGSTSLLNLTDADHNTNIGYASGNPNLGINNSSLGYFSMSSATSAAVNCSAFGTAAGRYFKGISNSAFGNSCMGGATNAGDNNNGFGTSCLFYNDGDNNCGFGSNSLGFLTVGNGNNAFGNNSGSNYTTNESNNICIANDGTIGESDTIRIGDSQTRCFTAGIYNVPVSGNPVICNSDGQQGAIATPAFIAYLNSNLPNATGNGTVIQIPFDDVVKDNATGFTSGSGALYTFQAGSDGDWLITATTTFEPGATSGELYAQDLVFTGSDPGKVRAFSTLLPAATTQYITVTTTTIRTIEAGDTVFVQSQNLNGSQDTDILGNGGGTVQFTSFVGKRLL